MIPLFLGVLAGWETYELRRAGPWRYTFRGKIMELGKSFGERSRANTRNVPRDLVGERNVKAFMAVIREKESGGDYGIIVGAQRRVTNYKDHPRIRVGNSSAAGAYQFQPATWDQVKADMGLKDFTPASQDMAALGYLAYLGALPAVIDGRFAEAVKKCATSEGWTSLPGAKEQQWTMGAAAAFFQAKGGKIVSG